MKTEEEINKKIEELDKEYKGITEENTAYTNEYDWGFFSALKWVMEK